MSQMPEQLMRDVILDSIADGVVTVDEQWRVTSFNRAAERITGVPREEAFGKPCCEVLRASVCDNGCALRETCRTGQPVVDKLSYLENAAGRRIPISISTAVLHGGDGRVIGGVETFRDVSMVEQLRDELRDKHTFVDIIGRSPPMQRLFDVLPQFAESTSTVLIEGASGTGKELFARAIHDLSPRRDKKFIAVNCGALPDTLLESELFGYRAGAFTDARHDKPGRFALADGGTIFLDEIGDVSSAMQIKLLRVLQERVFEPLGSVESVKVNVRVIAATNKDLGRLVRQGAFREDLYYRVNIVRLRLPPLRERREDISLLVDHFLAKFNRLQGKRVVGVSDEVLAILLTHDYPGNIRELENIIEYAFVLCRGGVIEPEHLPPALRELRGFGKGCRHNGLTLRDLEALHIRDALQRSGGNRTAAARTLGINPSTLFRKLKALQIQVPNGDGRRQRNS
jgi:PAS domain S-box-containing protein